MKAACLGLTHLFFPSRGDFETSQTAKAICAGCAARTACADLARANKEQYGLWGGLSIKDQRGTPYQRKRPA